MPVPKTCYPKSENDLKEISDTVGFPCIIKPAIGYDFLKTFKSKVFLCNDNEELRTNYIRSLEIMKPDGIMVQENISGSSEYQYSVGLFVDKDRIYNCLVARRTRQNPPDFGTGTTYAEAVHIPELIGYSEKILYEVQFSGICEVEFKYDNRDGLYKFLEVNARIWRWHVLTEDVGILLLLIMYMCCTSGYPIDKKDNLECVGAMI